MPQLSDDRGRTKVYQVPEPISASSSWHGFHGELHPDTDPAVIFAGHCDEVSAAVETLRAAFPPEPTSKESNARDPDLPEREVIARLKRAINGETLGTMAIAKAANLHADFVRRFMKARPAAFEMIKVPRKPLQWKLVESFGGLFNGASRGGSPASRARTKERRSVSKKAVAA